MTIRRLAVALLALVALASPARSRPPNIVIIFCDDLGYADIGCFADAVGEEIGWATPNIDRLAEQGITLTDFYVSQPVCSASRASLLTGSYANRVGISGALGPGSGRGIHARETTLAELCKDQGFATACFGKWHLGHHPEFLPTRHGFDAFFGIPYSNDMWPHHPNPNMSFPELPLFDGEQVINPAMTADDQRVLTRDITLRAVDFIGAHADEPFFLYVPHPMPHVPLFTSASFEGSSEDGTYGDVIQEIDWSVGEIMKALDRHGLTDDTLVIFTSDNGPWLNYGNHAGRTGPLREGKGTTFEGGVRVPFVARLPGVIPAGAVSSEPVMTIDLLPTIAGLIGAPMPDLPIDGHDIAPILRGEQSAVSPYASGDDALYFWYHAGDLEAMRHGKWKLHFPHAYRTMTGGTYGMDGAEGRYVYGARTELALFNLETDIGEQRNLAEDYPEVVARLTALADAKRAELGDRLVGVTGSANREAGRVADEPEGDEQIEGSPLAPLAFLEGHWRGTLGGTPVEEVWLAPSGNNVTGVMRWFDADGALRLTEVMSIESIADGAAGDDRRPTLLIRHFNPGLKPWESEAERPTTCRLASHTENSATFEAAFADDDLVSILYELVDERTMRTTLTFDHGDGPSPFTIEFTRER